MFAVRFALASSIVVLCRPSTAHTTLSVAQKFIYQVGKNNICLSNTFSTSSIFGVKTTTMVNKAEYTLPNNTDVVPLDCHSAFKALTETEKKYAHYLSKASWYGSLICLHQTSPESPGIFLLFQRLFSKQPVAEFVQKLTAAGVAEEDVQPFFIYCGGFFANMGNYKSFGDTKITPNMSEESFERIISLSDAYNSEDFQTLWTSVKPDMFALDPPHVLQIGLKEEGISTYFSRNCDSADGQISLGFMDSKGLSPYNTRLFKEVDGDQITYIIRLASAETSDTASDASDVGKFLGTHSYMHEGKSYTFKVVRGDYAPLMKIMCDNLKLAKDYAANDNERNFLEQYILSFSEGSLEAHKNGSRFWIKNQGPIVENYIGFIESYRDPTGVRGEFEGFVAMVNKEQSAKFGALVNSAETYISYLPWDAALEKDTFLRPDFTSLEVLTFGSTGVPAGINIPNYDDIRQSEGFKNVHLGNVLSSSYKDAKVTFLSKEDEELFFKLKGPSFEVQVGLHELLGHGSGKLLFKHDNGTYNYDHEKTVNPLTNKQISAWYMDSESYSGKFADIGSSYEECRAECVGIYLCLHHEILKIFGHEGEVADNIIYINWLNMVRAGLLGLEFYTPETKTFRQAHMQARYAILRVLLEAGENFVQLKELTGEDGEPDLLLTLDRTKITTVGKKAIGDFLQKLQVYKSTGDYDSAKQMYDHYCTVSDNEELKLLSFRKIVMDRKQPRKLLVQHNTEIKDGEVSIKDYAGTAQAMVESNIDRFSGEDIYNIVHELWIKDAKHFV